MPDSETLARLAKELVPVVKHLYSLYGGREVKTKDLQTYFQQYHNRILMASDVTVAMHIAVTTGLIENHMYNEYPGDIRSLPKWPSGKWEQQR